MSKNHNVQLVHEDTRITSAWGKLMRIVSDAFADDTVNTPSDLTPALVPDGTMKYVENLKCTFIYDQNSTLTPDGITIIDSNFNGNWLRQDPAQDAWGKQATWYINSSTGLDTNPGTLALPIKTINEWKRRVPNGPSVDSIVNIISLAATDTFPTVVAEKGGKVQFKGTLGTPIESGTITTYATRNPAGTPPTPPTITKAAGDWTALIGKLIYFPARDSWSFIAKDLTGGAAAILMPMRFSGPWGTFGSITGTAIPQNGDAYEVYDLIPVHVPEWYSSEPPDAGWIIHAPSDSVYFVNLEFYAGAIVGGGIELSTDDETVFHCCSFARTDNFQFNSSSVLIETCVFGSPARTNGVSFLPKRWSYINNVLCITVNNGSAFLMGGDPLLIGKGGLMCVDCYPLTVEFSCIRLLDWILSIGGMAALFLDNNSICYINQGLGIYGIDVTVNVLRLDPGARLHGASATKLYGTTTGGNQLDVAQTANHLTNIIASAGGPLPAAASCVSFSELFNPATFNGTCFDYKTGAYIGV